MDNIFIQKINKLSDGNFGALQILTSMLWFSKCLDLFFQIEKMQLKGYQIVEYCEFHKLGWMDFGERLQEIFYTERHLIKSYKIKNRIKFL